MIVIRPPESIYQAHGTIHNGTFQGRWHFSFDQYADPEYTWFGVLQVLNDDTLSPSAVWPLHPHRGIEVLSYCAFLPRHGGYLYVMEGGPITAGAHPLPALAAALITAETQILVKAAADAELLLVDVLAA